MTTNKITLTRYFVYLDELRESGATNMFGAGAYLADEFGLDRAATRDVLSKWISTFDLDKSPEQRAATAAEEEAAK